MEHFLSYLQETSTASAIYRENVEEKINLCLGNVSCDMDSSIGVFILAYLLTHKSKYFDDPGNFENLYIPVINCPRGELEARLDITYHLEKHGIDLKKLTYVSDLDIDFYAKENTLSLSIIDHNQLDLHQSKWGDSVKMIVDHHVDTNAYDKNKDIVKLVTFCGSACSMAINLYFEYGFDALLNKELCEFFAPAILLDTENLKTSLKGNKWGDIDLTACSRMFRIMMSNTYNTLVNKKTDRKLNLQLGLDLILKKDYKNYTWNNTIAGISVIFNSFHEVINTFSLDCLRNLIIEKQKNNGLNIYMIITQIYVDEKVIREFMIYEENIEKFSKLKAAFEKNCPFKFKVKKFTGLSKNFAFYILEDDSVSRKKIEPIFKKIFEEEKY